MAVFDILKTTATCPFCGQKQEWNVIYRYGDCLEREKRIGDKITWSGESLQFYDYGENVGGHVQIHGDVDTRCGSCKGDPVYCIISIKDNVIQKIELFAKPASLGKKGHQRT